MLVLLVLSGLIISICMGLRQSLGLFMRPMTLELGISSATFGFAIALQNIVWGLSQPFVGALADRYGPRPVLIGTASIYAAGLLLMAFAKALGSARRALASASSSARCRAQRRRRSAARRSVSSRRSAHSARW